MQVDWKYITVALVAVSTVFALSLTSASAATGGMQGPGAAHQGGSQSGFSGAGQHVGDGVQTGGSMGQGGQGSRVIGEGSQQGGMGQGGHGQFAGGPGQRGIGERNIGERGIQSRNFDRQSFFGGHDHDWWRHNQKHHFWNGNAWVFGVEPVDFVAVPVPVSTCPYSPGTSGGDPNACFFNCADNGYDPVGVCNVCCGTNY